MPARCQRYAGGRWDAPGSCGIRKVRTHMDVRTKLLCLAVTAALFAMTTAGRFASLGDIAVHEDQYREFILPAMGMFSGDLNPHAFVYGAPSMYFIHGVWQLHYAALKAIGAPGIDTPLDYAAAFFVDPSRSYAAARAGFCALWFLLIWVACLTGARIGGVPVGCLVGAIVALTPVARERLMAMQPDTTIYLCAIVTLYVAVRMERKPTHDLLLGTIIGLGVAVKALGLMFAAAYLVWRIWDVRRSGLAPVAKSALTGMAGMCAGFILSSPFTVLAWDEFRTGMEFQLAYNQVSGYANRLETAIHVIGNLAWPTRGVGPIGLLAALVAFPTALRSPSEGLRFVAVTGIVGLSFLSLQPAFHRNWLIPAVPAVAVLAGMGAVLCSRWASQRWGVANHVAFAMCSVLIVGPILAHAVNQPAQAGRAQRYGTVRLVPSSEVDRAPCSRRFGPAASGQSSICPPSPADGRLPAPTARHVPGTGLLVDAVSHRGTPTSGTPGSCGCAQLQALPPSASMGDGEGGAVSGDAHCGRGPGGVA